MVQAEGAPAPQHGTLLGKDTFAEVFQVPGTNMVLKRTLRSVEGQEKSQDENLEWTRLLREGFGCDKKDTASRICCSHMIDAKKISATEQLIAPEGYSLEKY